MNEKLSHLIYTYLHLHVYNDFILDEVADFLDFATTNKIVPNNSSLYLDSIGISYNGHFSVLFDSYEGLYTIWILYNKEYTQDGKDPKYIIRVFDRFGNGISKSVKNYLTRERKLLTLDDELKHFLKTRKLMGGTGGDGSGHYPENNLTLGLLIKTPVSYFSQDFSFKLKNTQWLRYSLRPSPDLSLFSLTDFLDKNNLIKADAINILSNNSVNSISLNPFTFLYTGLVMFSTDDFRGFADGIGVKETPIEGNPYHFSMAPNIWFNENKSETGVASVSNYLPFGFLNDFYEFLLEQGDFVSLRYKNWEERDVG